MCGRFTLTLLEEDLKRRFRIQKILAEFLPRYNIAPSQKIPVVIKNEEGERVLTAMRWGLIPFWAKEAKEGTKMINARSETVAEKPSFKNLITKKRCLIPADGFYEWEKNGKTKTPLRITLREKELFAFAGLWNTWNDPKGETIDSCTILTCSPNPFMSQIHERMPVILTPKTEELWLDPELSDTAKLKGLLVPYSEELSAYPVSTLINSAKLDVPECIRQI